MKTLYMDETGATGNNVDDSEQPYFVLSSVVATPEEANTIIGGLKGLLKSQAPELKSAHIRRHARGAEGFEFVLSQLRQQARAMVYDKKLVVCMKIYDYLVDPAAPSIFGPAMNANLHRRVALELHRELLSETELAQKLYGAVVAALRHRNLAPLDSLRSIDSPPDLTFGRAVQRLLAKHWNAITDEIEESLAIEGAGRWLLDMSLPSVRWMCAYWSKRCAQLEVVCDRSKPLFQQKNVLESIVLGNRRRAFADGDYGNIGGVAELELGDSAMSSGIQLADVVAGAVSEVMLGRSTSARARRLIDRRCSILPPIRDIMRPVAMPPRRDALALLSRYG